MDLRTLSYFLKRVKIGFLMFVLSGIIFQCGLIYGESMLSFDTIKLNITTPNPVGSGARALGRGGAFIAIADDATAASWNPGGLLKITRPEVSIVGSYFSRDACYYLSNAEVSDISDDLTNLNYMSAAFPFEAFHRNMVFSINYQRLYEFSQDIVYTWRKGAAGAVTYIDMKSQAVQEGALKALSPSLALEIFPACFNVGITTNFWLKEGFDNYWEQSQIIEGKGRVPFGAYKAYAELLERFDFSGMNTHIGFLWEVNPWFTLGGIVKTPFRAGLNYAYKAFIIEEYTDDPARDSYTQDSFKEALRLEMPLSRGLGLSLRSPDRLLSIDMDFYYTRWDDYAVIDSSGRRISPINKRALKEANIKPTTQIRLGAEYLIRGTKPLVSIRSGIFYDPEPNSDHPDDFYGCSAGAGVKYPSVAFDLAYQYRFGKRTWAEDPASDVKQHYIYSSIILYF